MAGKKNRRGSRSNSTNGSGTTTPPPAYSPGEARGRKKNQGRGQNSHDNSGDTSMQNGPQQSPVVCTYCSKPYHKAEDCWTNPNSTRNAKASNTKTANPDNSQKSSNQEDTTGKNRNKPTVAAKPEFPTSGWTFANCIPITTDTQTPYCGPCNSRAHHTSRCGDKDASHRFWHSLIVCWRCAYRGHTGDECQNPEPTEFVKRCGVCREQKHATDACPHQAQRRLCEALAYGRAAPRSVFPYTANDTEMTGTDQQQQLAVPTFSRPSRAPTPRTLTISTSSPSRLAELRRKVNDSATLYTKSLYNMVLARNSSEIQAVGLLSQSTWWEVSKRLAQGFNFFRDPQAMGAIVLNRRPYCYQCAKEGVILDENMCGVQGRDPLTIEDGARWGVFVMFECQCSKDGYDYV